MYPGGFRFILLAVLFSVCDSEAAIFGLDTRENVTPISRSANLARATAVAVLSANFKINENGLVDLEVNSAADFLCRDEKFGSDPSLSYACTGFLVGRDLLLTAGHCMVNTGQTRNEQKTYCEAFSWLFDYQAQVDGSVKVKDLPADKLYGCQRIIYAVREEQPPFRDFAIVKLNRPVEDRTPLKLATRDPQIGDSLSMIGYPLGMPAKLAKGASVLLNDLQAQSLITNLDAFEGNSGSPVFNRDFEVVGILIGGTPVESLRPVEGRKCQMYNRCDDFGNHCDVPDRDLSKIPDFQAPGSIVQRIGPVKKILETQTMEALR